MGNNQQKQNSQFGKNFNFAEHNRKMQGISQNYENHSLNIQRSGQTGAPKQQEFEQLQRKNAIYKPSIDISLTNQIKVSFQYKSEQGCEFFIYLGVNNINQNPVTKHTTQIQADYQFKQFLPAEAKALFKKIYPYKDNNLMKKQIVIRLQNDQQATQISLRKVNQAQQHWKIILQKFQFGDKVYELENIYGGGDGGQQCIICMCEASNTIVKPCNHLCLCKDCAKTISTKTNKCPICRNNISELVTVNKSAK